MKYIFILFLFLNVMFAGDFVIPWVAESDQYTSTLVVNNHANVTLSVTLTAVKGDGSSDTQQISIEPFASFRQSDMSVLFGLTGGMSIHITTSHDKTSIGIITTSLRGSGTSPAQGDAMNLSNASTTLSFPYMPESHDDKKLEGTIISAVVVTNTSMTTTANVIFMLDNDPDKTFTTAINPMAPYANLINAMFDMEDGEHVITATSDGPGLIGANFVFNDLFEPSMANAVPTLLDTPPANTVPMSFTNDIQPIFTQNCIFCHGSNGGLTLSSDVSWKELVTDGRVIPGDHENSFLYKRLKGIGVARMPKGAAPLPDETIDKVVQWINEGALDN